MVENRADLLVTWECLKHRHKGIDVRSEWDKYTKWREFKGFPKITPSINTILTFEKNWLKSLKVTRIRNPELYRENEKEIALNDIEDICGLLIKRKMFITEDEATELLRNNITVTNIELWISNNIMPKNPYFKRFLASKNIK